MNTLVLNMGLKSIRSIIINELGEKLAFASLPLQTTIRENHVAQWPEEWWDKSLQVIKATLENQRIRESVKYLTVTTSSSCLVAVDQTGAPLYEAIMVSDNRAKLESSYIAQLKEFAEVKRSTGLACNHYLMLPKILWLKNNHLEIFDKTYKFLSPNDYLMGRLTGTFCTDELNAQKYHYDTETKKYPQQLLSVLGIPPEKLPSVVTPGTELGPLTREVQQKLRLKPNTRAVLSTYDAICSFIGSGPKGLGEACDVSGTVTSVRIFSPKPLKDNHNRIFDTPLNSLGLNIAGSSNNLGGGLIEWAKQCFYNNEEHPYEIMEAEAKNSPLGAYGLIFLPYLLGERAPLWDSDARGVLMGLERVHSRKDIARAVFESSGYCTKSLIDVIEGHKIPVERIRLSGGLTNIDLVSRIKADVAGKEVLVIDDFETTSLGAAILVGLQQGCYSTLSEASDACVRVRTIIVPNRKNHLLYQELFQLYQDTYYALRTLFKKRAALMQTLYPDKKEKICNL